MNDSSSRTCPRFFRSLVALLAANLAVAANAQGYGASDLLPNGRWLDDGRLLVGGQPTPDQLRALADAGVRTIVNLRRDGEPEAPTHAEAAATSKALGIAYHALPVSGSADLTPEAARTLADLLAAAEGPVAVHCASGNRVGALLALVAFFVDGSEPEAALVRGTEGGLTRLEPAVREILGLPAAPPTEVHDPQP